MKKKGKTGKRLMSLLLTMAMSVSNMAGVLPAYAEEADSASAEQTVETEVPQYEAVLPYYDGLTYSYDSARVKEAVQPNTDITLLYEAGEEVEVSLAETTGTRQISEIRIWDDENKEVGWSWTETGAVELYMPESNIRFEVSFAEIQTEPVTEAPTEPITQAPTEPATEAQTEPVTEVPTEAVTEAPTEAVTEAPTEAVTEAPAEPTTEAPTEAVTEAPTEAVTEAPTEAVMEAPTEAVTEAPTEAVTEAPAEPTTEAPTEVVTEAPAEPTTEAPTEPVTEATTEPATEAPTEPVTEAPVDAYEPVTESDGLPEQGSIVSVDAVSIPYDTWDFDPEADFTNINYDTELFSISHVSNDIVYDTPGTYSSIYKVTENATGKFWFILRPVIVMEPEETEAPAQTEIPVEPGTEPATEAVTESEASETAKVTFVVEGNGTVEVKDGDGNTAATVSSGDSFVYEGETGENLTVTMKAKASAIPFAMYRSDAEATIFEDASAGGEETATLTLTEEEEEVEIDFLSQMNYAMVTMSLNEIMPLANTGTWDNPAVGDVYTGRGYISGSTPGYSISSSYGPGNSIYFTCTGGDAAGYTFNPTQCISGHTYAGPLVGTSGSYSIRITSVDYNTGKVGISFTITPDNHSSGYQIVSGSAQIDGPRFGTITIQKKTYFSSDSRYDLIAYSDSYKDLTTKFNVYSDPDCTNLVDEVTTNSDGVGTTDGDLNIGRTYYIKEVTPPKNHMLQERVYSVTISTSGAKVTVYNRPYSIDLKIKKVDERTGEWNDDLKGTQVSLYSGKACKASQLIETITINSEDGRSFNTKIPLGVTYYYKETHATDGYDLNEKVYSVRFTESGIDIGDAAENGLIPVERTIENTSSPFNISIRVRKSMSNVPSAISSLGIYDLSDIDYGIYTNRSCTREIGEVTTLENGYSNYLTIDSNDYPSLTSEGEHTVYIKEKTGNRSVAISDEVYEATYTVSNNQASDGDIRLTVRVSDKAVVGYGVLVQKYARRSGTTEPLPGAQITVTYADAQQGANIQTRKWVFLTDSNGQVNSETAANQLDPSASSDALFRDNDGNVCWPRGYYTIQETKTPEGFEGDDAERYITMRSDPDDRYKETCVFTYVTLYNDETSRPAYVTKTSANTAITNNNSMYSLEGAKFKVEDSTGKTVATLTTNAQGRTETVNLPVGTYKVTETTAPKGYKLDSTPKNLVVTSSNSASNPATVSFADEPITASIDALLEKTTPYLTTRSLAGAEFKVEFFGNANHSGTPLRTWVIKTIEEEDGFYAYLTSACKVSGDAFYGEGMLPLGSIRITETKAPAGYTISNEVKTATITQSGYAGNISFANDATYEEIPEFGGLSIRKYDSQSGSTAQGNATLEGAVYNIVNNNEVEVSLSTNPDIGYAKGEVVMQITTNASGIASTGNEILQSGNYIVYEVSAPTGYQVDPTRYTYTVTDKTITDRPSNASAHGGSDEDVIRGGFTVTKKDYDTSTAAAQGDATLAGAQFTLYNKSAKAVIVDGRTYNPDAVIATFTTDANGVIRTASNYLPYGTYRLVETKAPTGYTGDGAYLDRTFSITSNGQMYTPPTEEHPENEVIRGGFSITKKDIVSKTNVPQGDASLKDAEFTLYNKSAKAVVVNGTSYNPGSVIAVLKTDENGSISTAADYLPYGTYRLVETKAPAGYTLDGSNLDITFKISIDGQMYTPGDTEQPQDDVIHGGFTVTKEDYDTVSAAAQGDATLEGAQFTLYNMSANSVYVDGSWYENEAVIGIFTTGADGKIQTATDYLPYGTYRLVETKAPAGYTGDGANLDITFYIRTDGQIFTPENAQAQPQNEVIRGGFELYKWDQELNEAGVTQGDATLEGAEFTLTNESAHYVMVDTDGDGTLERYEPNAVIATFTTDEEGHIATAADYLPYGSYVLTETQPPEGYTANGENLTRHFTIRTDGEYHSWDDEETAAKNRVIRFDIQIIKFRDTLSSEDATDDVEPIEGVVFDIYLKSTMEYVMSITTDEEGVATTKDPENYPYGRLPYGEYLIREVEHPADVSPVEDFTVNGTIDGKTYSGIYKNDKPIEAPITVLKVDAESTKIVAEEGFEFQILDENKEVVTFDVYYPHPEKVTNFITDESGTVTLPEKLLYGTYYIHEVSAPYGYVLADDMEFTITEYGAWTEIIEIPFADMPAKGKIVVNKYDKETHESLAGAVFDVFADEDIVTPDGTIHYAKGQWIESFTIGEDGVGESSELYLGKYYVQESQAPEGYCLDDTRHEFELVYEDDETPIVYAHYDAYNLPTTLNLYKTDIDGQALEGISFDITLISDIYGNPIDQGGTGEPDGPETELPESEGAQDGQEETGETVEETDSGEETESQEEPATGAYVTNAEGMITEKYLTSGIYEVREVSTLPGYVLDDTVRYVTVDRNGFIYESDASGNNLDADGGKSHTETLAWENDYTKLEISKTDITGEAEIPGAQMQILDEEGTVVYEWTSTEELHRIDRIPAGKYTLVEVQAPAGFVLASEIEFIVEETGEVQTVEMTDKQVIVSKKAITGEDELPGAELMVTDAAGNVVDSWVSGEEPHAVSGLTVGQTYTLTEVTAPEGYAIATSIEFTVEDDGEIQQIEMIDKQVIVSKRTITGEDELPGAELTVTDAEGNVVDSWISGEEPHAVSGLTVGQTYTLTEVTAPVGYAIATSIEFTVEDNGEIQQVTMIDKRILVVKVDTSITGLAGAELEVRDTEGNVIDAWTSDGTPHAVSGLKVGESYVLVETKAPEGYAIASEIPFTVADDAEDTEISLVNKQVLVHKTDVTGTEELEGAFMEVRDAEGNVVDSWVSNGTAHAISGITVGQSYVLYETAAPEGFVVASEIPFNVADDGTVQHVYMADKQVLVTKYDVTGEEELPGAELTVTDAEGNVVDSWTSGEEAHAVKGLTVGQTYTLTEVTAPAGYAIATAIEFTVEDDGKIQQVAMVDKQVFVSKRDVTGEEELPGAQLTVTDSEGTVVDSWTSGEEPHAVSGLKVGGTYTLTEVAAPTGYSIAESIIFTVTDDGAVQQVVMYDDVIEVQITKADITDNEELPGAELVITDSEGKEVDRWVSGKEPHSINLAAGTYTLTETLTPAGYATAESIVFTVTDSREIQTVTMYDYPIQVEISKTDITTGKELPGATLTITDGEGNVVETWTSTDEPHTFQLPVGTYTLTEVLAPEGYATAEAVEFTVTDTKEIQKVEMQDYPLGVTISKKDITNEEELPGATLTITDSEGKIVDQWVSEENPHYVSLPLGDYTLTEVSAPEGYATAESIEFTVTDTKEAQAVTMYDTPIQVEISKKDITNEEELPGAELTITDSEGNEIEKWTSTDEPHTFQLPEGEYTLTEVTAPDGYATAESIEFTVTDTMEVQHVTMYDTPLTVEISKKDITNDEELPGAELTITDSEGNEVEKWTSTDEPHRFQLPEGEYTLTEVTAPDGYATAESIEFTVTDTMDVQHVTMYDTPLTVEISKKDITNDEELPGARLVVKDSDGKTVEEWISSDEPHKIQLPQGEYTLTEITAPEGYEVAETIEFTVTDTMDVQHVTMYDTPKDDTVDLTGKTDTTSNTTPGTPSVIQQVTTAVQTGDFFRYLPAVILIAAGAVIILIAVKRRKGQDGEK